MVGSEFLELGREAVLTSRATERRMLRSALTTEYLGLSASPPLCRSGREVAKGAEAGFCADVEVA